MRRALSVVLSLGLLGGCSSMMESKPKQIAITTNPPGAQCGLYRHGSMMMSVDSTPAVATVGKSENDIWVVCVKEGYQQAAFYSDAESTLSRFGNMLLDANSGGAKEQAADPDVMPINITMTPSRLATRSGPPQLPDHFHAIVTAGLPIMLPAPR